MKNIIEENYKSIVERGLITSSTKVFDFIDKLDEEVLEFKEATNKFIKSASFKNAKNMDEELADIILVCLNIAKHYNIDIENEIDKKIKKNYERANR